MSQHFLINFESLRKMKTMQLWPKHRYRKAKNRLLKFCYVPAISAAQNKLLFFAAAVYSTNEANKAGLKQSIFLDVYEPKVIFLVMCDHRHLRI